MVKKAWALADAEYMLAAMWPLGPQEEEGKEKQITQDPQRD